jgi:hypothetical protein
MGQILRPAAQSSLVPLKGFSRNFGAETFPLFLCDLCGLTAFLCAFVVYSKPLQNLCENYAMSDTPPLTNKQWRIAAHPQK